MKKTVLIVGLLILAASCQKEVIRPNECPTQDSFEKRSTTITDPTNDGTNPNSDDTELSGSGSGDDNTTEPGDDNGITDPMRKKDKKDNK